MTGILLMISGIILFIAGLAIYLNPAGKSKDLSENKQTLTNFADIQESGPAERLEEDYSLVESTESAQNLNQPVSSESLEKVIRMAIADGVLTNNERKLIKELVEESGQDFDTIIADIESKMAEMAIPYETQLVDFNKKSGDDFEKFVVQKFNPEYFRLKEWAGDKYVNGIYAETTLQPDLLLEFRLKGKTSEFAVECKWRSDFKRGGIEFATIDQYNRYIEFGRNRNVPVFIVIGVGGQPDNPRYFYVVPLSELKSNYIDSATLKKYGKWLDTNFFFDMETGVLR